MSLSWETYLFIAGLAVGSVGIGVAYGHFRLGWKELIDAVT